MTSDASSDRQAISDLLDDYAVGIDDKDWALVRAVFASDARLDYTAFGGPKGSPDDVIPWLEASVAAFALTQHFTVNRRIRIDGDRATSRADLLAPMGMPAGEGTVNMLLTGGVYRDTIVRTSDGWRITERTMDRAWLAQGPQGVHGPTGPAS
jgi:hypothetical protein